jgi:hypothetical protein
MLLAAARIAGAVLIVAAAVQGIAHTATVVNFFSFFTVLSNLFAGAVLLIGALRRPASPRWDLVRGAAVVYMVTTGIVFLVLLQSADEVERYTPEFLNWVMHRVMPVYMALDWLVDPPRRVLQRRDVLAWLAFPLAYAAYTLVRGPLAGDWYPYPFLDPDEHGYGGVLVSCVGVAAFIVLLAFAVVWAGNRERRRPPALQVS